MEPDVDGDLVLGTEPVASDTVSMGDGDMLSAVVWLTDCKGLADCCDGLADDVGLTTGDGLAVCSGLLVTADDAVIDCTGLLVTADDAVIDCNGLAVTRADAVTDCNGLAVMMEADCNGLMVGVTMDDGVIVCNGLDVMTGEAVIDCNGLGVMMDDGVIVCNGLAVITEADCNGLADGVVMVDELAINVLV